MQQIRFEIAFTKDAFPTTAESDWIDLLSGKENEQLQELRTNIAEVFMSEHGYVSCKIGGVETHFNAKYIVSIKLPTQTVD